MEQKVFGMIVTQSVSCNYASVLPLGNYTVPFPNLGNKCILVGKYEL